MSYYMYVVLYYHATFLLEAILNYFRTYIFRTENLDCFVSYKNS